MSKIHARNTSSSDFVLFFFRRTLRNVISPLSRRKYYHSVAYEFESSVILGTAIPVIHSKLYFCVRLDRALRNVNEAPPYTHTHTRPNCNYGIAKDCSNSRKREHDDRDIFRGACCRFVAISLVFFVIVIFMTLSLLHRLLRNALHWRKPLGLSSKRCDENGHALYGR